MWDLRKIHFYVGDNNGTNLGLKELHVHKRTVIFGTHVQSKGMEDLVKCCEMFSNM